MKDVLILGIGDVVLNDAGVGVHIIHLLRTIGGPDEVELVDGGLGGALLPLLQHEYKQLIVVDAMVGEGPVGIVRRLSPSQLPHSSLLMSSHEPGVHEFIRSLQQQEPAPQIDMLAISVGQSSEQGVQLSPEIRRVVPQVLQLIYEILEDARHLRYFR